MNSPPPSLRALSALALAGTLALGACSDGTPTAGGEQSTLSVQLTDAPTGELKNAWVEITEIYLQGSEGRVTLLDESTGLVELLGLAGTTRELISDKEVPPGTYNQLRLVVGAAAVETEGGEVFSKDGAAGELGLTATGTLICPSCAQTGIKVNLPEGGFTVETGSQIMVLDFDAKQSFGHQAGRSGNWVMNPVVTSSKIEASGNISGTVAVADTASIPECPVGTARSVEDFVPEARDPSTGDLVKSGTVQSDGSYEISFVAPGDYDMAFAEAITTSDSTELSFSATVAPEQVTVQSGQESTADYTITAASCDSTSSGSGG